MRPLSSAMCTFSADAHRASAREGLSVWWLHSFCCYDTNMPPQAVRSSGAGSLGVVSSMPHVSSHADSPTAHGDTWPIGHRPHLPPPDPTWACGLTRCRAWVPGPGRALCMPGWLGPDFQGHSPTYSGPHSVTSSLPAPPFITCLGLRGAGSGACGREGRASEGSRPV